MSEMEKLADAIDPRKHPVPTIEPPAWNWRPRHDDLIAASNALRQHATALEIGRGIDPRPIIEWHEDMGPMLWWKFPIVEPPYCGSPLDCPTTVKLSIGGAVAEEYTFGGFPDYVTHFTPISLPNDPARAVIASLGIKNG